MNKNQLEQKIAHLEKERDRYLAFSKKQQELMVRILDRKANGNARQARAYQVKIDSVKRELEKAKREDDKTPWERLWPGIYTAKISDCRGAGGFELRVFIKSPDRKGLALMPGGARSKKGRILYPQSIRVFSRTSAGALIRRINRLKIRGGN